ncbi:hypothetical protein IV203_003902 [Nitzschia inconspicua]|uniref:Uncharacterized protein n=1 Tax=Nitzschia inconspicua TaxID=303405 RepID=A0A9K3L4C3_9STRA|nr:hypothetical protein IV203_003902 [Nitzschia inconspicua]
MKTESYIGFMLVMALTTGWCFIRCEHHGTRFPTPPLNTSSFFPSISAHPHHHAEALDVENKRDWSSQIFSIAHEQGWNSLKGKFEEQKEKSIHKPVEVQEVWTRTRRLLRGGASKVDQPPTSLSSSQRRKLPGYANKFGAPGTTGFIVLIIVVLFLLFCCRGMLCDILACVCLYEICCGDGAVGGFDLM